METIFIDTHCEQDHASEGLRHSPFQFTGLTPGMEISEPKKSWTLGGREHIIHTIHLFSPGQEPERTSAISCLIDPALIPLLPSPLPILVDTCDGEPSFVVRPSHKVDVVTMQNEEIGYGLYATRFIPAGTLIIREHPALICPPGKYPDDAYEQLGNALPEKRRSELLSMANCYRVKHPKEGEEVVHEVDGIVRTNAMVLELKTPIPDRKVKTLLDDLPKEFYGGVYPLINRGNHSCGPNSEIIWNQDTLSLSLYALQDIVEGDEILKSYADPAQPREKRMEKLFNNYRFHCDCPWCDVRVDGTDGPTREEKIKASDDMREALGTWIFTHPTYKKWSDDLCASDDLVIKSHQAALSLLEAEGVYTLQLFLVEEIALCYAMLGDEMEFKRWGERTVQLSQVADKETHRKFLDWLVDPPKKINRWGWRKKQREQKSKRPAEFEADTGEMHFLFQVEDSDSD